MRIEGMISEIVFTNEQNGFTVCTVDTEDDSITAVGTMPGVSPGMRVELSGVWTSHQDYGKQLKVTGFSAIQPKSESQILMYLSAGIVKGIGPATAKKIVDRFGEEAIEVIRDRPGDLIKIKGISERKAAQMHESFMEKQASQGIVMFLQTHGVTPALAMKVYKKFGTDAADMVREDPYSLCEIQGISFKAADRIARGMSFELTHESRLKHGVRFVLEECAQNGHTYIMREDLAKMSASLLNCSADIIENTFEKMILTGMLVRENINDGTALYLPYLYNAEIGVARRLCGIMETHPKKYGGDFENKLLRAQEENKITLSQEQSQACKMALEHGVSIITGGPGTGKTTIINIIISIMQEEGLSIALSAPTGRAAKRLTETCGIEAKTIHRLLELNFSEQDEEQIFSRDETFPIDENVVIVDEMSMVDILLMNALLKALRPGAILVMVGDADQLPSVGAGNVLRDMIDSEKIPVARLTEIYRQAARSMIIVNAHRINRGENPIIKKDKDFFFIEKNDGDEIMKTVTDICSVRLKKAYGLDPLSDIQVISPTRKTALGVYELNRRLQEISNPPSVKKREKSLGDVIFREGDRVAQKKNNYSIPWINQKSGESGEGVFNGDIGTIQRISKGESVAEVLYDGERLIKYDFSQMDEIEMAYAVTVHKSQGSEFPAVVIPLYPCAPKLLSRNLLYTALTRASKLVILVGRRAILERMIVNNSQSKRFSGLRDKLCLV